MGQGPSGQNPRTKHYLYVCEALVCVGCNAESHKLCLSGSEGLLTPQEARAWRYIMLPHFTAACLAEMLCSRQCRSLEGHHARQRYVCLFQFFKFHQRPSKQPKVSKKTRYYVSVSSQCLSTVITSLCLASLCFRRGVQSCTEVCEGLAGLNMCQFTTCQRAKSVGKMSLETPLLGNTPPRGMRAAQCGLSRAHSCCANHKGNEIIGAISDK